MKSSLSLSTYFNVSQEAKPIRRANHPHEMTDQELIKGCISRNKTAQRALYDRYTPRLYAIGLRYVKNPHTAQDLLSEAWVKIFKNLKTVKNAQSLKGWISKIMSNECLMYLRKKKLEIAELSDVVIARTPKPVEVINKLEEQDIIDLLHQLPIGCKTIFNLYVLEGYKHREIAEKLDISINTSKSQLILAKQKLREAYLTLAEKEGFDLRPKRS